MVGKFLLFMCTCVVGNMQFEASMIAKSFKTKLALIRLGSSMHSFMSLQVGKVCVRLGAVLKSASVRSIP